MRSAAPVSTVDANRRDSAAATALAADMAAAAGFAPEADGYARFDRGNLAL
jgi:hypothetical protein